VPSQPADVIRRSSRWAGQRWLLDAVIGLVGPEWDQGRVAYYAAACGQDSQVDFSAGQSWPVALSTGGGERRPLCMTMAGQRADSVIAL
jgi:hypothetical protein